MTITYVRSLDLAAVKPSLEVRGLAEEAEPQSLDDTATAAVAGGSVLSFAQGLASDNKPDILDSLQLAQRAADKAHDRFGQPRKWFGKLLEVLTNTGWTVTASTWAEHKLEKGEYQVAKSAVRVLGTIATAGQAAMLSAALAALEGLSEDDGYITLFERYAVKDSIGSFLISAAEQNADGTVALSFGSFEMKAQEKRRKILFVRWSENQVSFWAGIQTAVFDPAAFAPMRSAVREMLGAARADYVKQLRL